MEANRREVDPSGQELIEGEQNGQTVQPLVGNHNDQNVKSPVATKRARNPGKDKKYRGKKKQKTEDTERQLENARADHAELKKKYDELKNTHAYSDGKLDQAKEDMELIKGCCSLMQQVVTQQHAWINMLQPLLVAGTINQFGGTMEPGGPVFEESLPQSHQVERAHWNNVEQPGLTYGGDLDYTSLLGAAMASGSSLMQGSLALGGQGNNSEQPTSYNADQLPVVN